MVRFSDICVYTTKTMREWWIMTSLTHNPTIKCQKCSVWLCRYIYIYCISRRNSEGKPTCLMSLKVKKHIASNSTPHTHSPKPHKTPPQLLKLQLCTHLVNVTNARLIPVSTFHSNNLGLAVASCPMVQLPHLLYSNGQCPVTQSITHYWWDGPQRPTTPHEKSPISSHPVFQHLPLSD